MLCVRVLISVLLNGLKKPAVLKLFGPYNIFFLYNIPNDIVTFHSSTFTPYNSLYHCITVVVVVVFCRLL